MDSKKFIDLVSKVEKLIPSGSSESREELKAGLKTLIEDYEEGHTQMSIEFLKWREHMNTFYSKKRIAIINRSTGLWDIFPMLTKTQRSIYLKLKEGKKAEDIIEIMESAVELKVPNKVDYEHGPNWGEIK